METSIVTLPEILFIGLRIRTSYRNELHPETSQIAKIINEFRRDNVDKRIPHRKSPGRLMVVYTNYASDEYDEYDYLIGEEVTTLMDVPIEMRGLDIPPGKYLKVTSDRGAVHNVTLDAWTTIWEMTANNNLGAERKYQVDFEIYDERAADPNQTVVDIYLGVK